MQCSRLSRFPLLSTSPFESAWSAGASCLARGNSNDTASRVSVLGIRLATVCSAVIERLPESDEALTQVHGWAPSSGGRCDGTKVTVHHSLRWLFGRIDACCAAESTDSVTVTHVFVDGVDLPLLQGLWFPRQCVLKIVPPLCFRFGFPGRNSYGLVYHCSFGYSWPGDTSSFLEGLPCLHASGG